MSIFYSLAYRHSKENRSIKDLFLLPALTSLGIALAVNNGRAFLSAIFNRTSEFIRTPKSGSTELEPLKVPRKYQNKTDKSVYIETFLAVYSLTALFVAIKMNLLFTIPFLLTFFLGYLYFSLKGLKEQYE
jgi:ABC-type sugar transport system permease subunit